MNFTRYAFDCRIDMYHFYTDQLTYQSFRSCTRHFFFSYSPLQEPSHTLSNPQFPYTQKYTHTQTQTHMRTCAHMRTTFICAHFHCIDRITQQSFVLDVIYSHFHVSQFSQQHAMFFSRHEPTKLGKVLLHSFFIKILFIRIPRLKIA